VTTKSMSRARRSARAVLHGPEILAFVGTNKNRKLLVAAAEAGHPPVAAISSQLEKLVGLKDAKLLPVRQFVGLSVRAVLEEEGFEVADTGVRLSNDPVFRTGAVYRRAAAISVNGSSDLLQRFIDALTEEEARIAHDLLSARIKASRG
jgi:hypothetical protein